MINAKMSQGLFT